MAPYHLPPENWMIKMAPIVAVMGMMIVLVGMILSFVAADLVSDAASDADDAQTLEEFRTYLMPLTLSGVGFLLMSIAVFLRGIFKGIRAMGSNVTHALNVGFKQTR